MHKYQFDYVNNEQQWEELLEQVETTHMTQTWGFGEAKKAVHWHPNRILIKHDGIIIAICQVLFIKVLGISILARINRGPLVLRQHQDHEVNIYNAIRRRWKYFIHGLLLIAPAMLDNDDSAETLKRIGFHLRRRNGWSSARVDLTLEENQLRKQLAGFWRNRLNNSERQGLEFRVCKDDASVAWMLERHKENMQQKNFKGTPVKLLAALRAHSPDNFIIYQACLSGEPVAGLIAYKFGDVAEYYIAWFSAEGRKLNAGNFVYWNAALHLKQLGCHYIDLGGYTFGMEGRGLNEFKQGVKGKDYQLLGEWWV